MPKAVIPIQVDLPEGSPLLSENAGEVQAALARVEAAVGEAISEVVGADVGAVAIWTYRGTHRSTSTDRE